MIISAIKRLVGIRPELVANARIIPITLSCIAILYITNCILLYLNPLTQYEFSFYLHIGAIFWANSIILFGLGCFLLIFTKDMKKVHSTIVCAFILLNNLIILVSPYICGVFLMSPGDLATYIGMILSIFENHTIYFGQNFYPITHIFAYSISAISQISPNSSFIFLSPLFSLLSPIFIFMTVRKISKFYYASFIAFLIASSFYLSGIFPINSTTTPFGLSLLLMPVIIYLIVRYRERPILANGGLILILLSFYVFVHPLTGVLLSSLCLSIFVIDILLKVVRYNKLENISHENIYLIFPIFFITYILYLTRVWERHAKNIFDAVEEGVMEYSSQSGYRVSVQQNVDKLDLDIIDTISLFFKMFGHQFVLVVITLISILYIFKMRKEEKIKANLYWIIPMVSWPVITAILLSIQVIKPVLVISFYRFLYALLVVSPIFVSLMLSTINRKKISALLILIIYASSIFVVYPSPYISYTNPQVTFSEKEGSTWLDKNIYHDYPVYGYLTSSVFKRIMSSLIPYDQYSKNVDRYRYNTLTNHFGYVDYDKLGDYTETDSYLILSTLDTIAYIDVYKNLNRIDRGDLSMLDGDESVTKIYNNGQVSISYVKGIF